MKVLLASLQGHGYVITSPWQDLPGQLALGWEIQPLHLWTHSIEQGPGSQHVLRALMAGKRGLARTSCPGHSSQYL